MRNLTEIASDISDLKEKIESLNSEISEKKEDLQKLRSNNARLLAANVGKTRKPMSLHTQIEKIRSSEIEIEQSEAAIKILEGQQRDLEEELFISELNEDLQKTYWPESEAYLEKAAEIRGMMGEVVRLVEVLAKNIGEFGSLPDPLSVLQRGFSKIENYKQWESLAFPWDIESGKYKQFTEIMADEKRISNLPKILKHFSDIFFGIESSGPQMPSRLRLLADEIPEAPTRKGSVYTGGGAKMRREPDEIPDIVKHPEKYDERDVKKFAAQVANRR